MPFATKHKHNEYQRKRRKLLKQSGLCAICKEPLCKQSSAFCKKHLQMHKEYQRVGKRKKEISNEIETLIIVSYEPNARQNIFGIL